jgi:hypothetical protein
MDRGRQHRKDLKMKKDGNGRDRRARHSVLRYAEKRGWTMTGLPDHGACIEVLARIIAMAERRGMHIGRWRDSFSAIYGAFVGNARPRSYSRHGCWWMDTRGSGGVTTDSEACRNLLAYEEELGKLTDDQWAVTRKEARDLGVPSKRRRTAVVGTNGMQGEETAVV